MQTFGFLKSMERPIYSLRFSATILASLYFWYWFMSKTDCQYWAGMCSPLESRMCIKERRSFSKQLPPNPGLQLRYLEPILESDETISLMSWIEQSSNFSVKLVREFMELILWANIALDISFPNSELAFSVWIIFEPSLKSVQSFWKQSLPILVFGVPITSLSGLTKLLIA